jgi:hypothetical protein
MMAASSSSRTKKRNAPATQLLDWMMDDVSEGATFTSQHISEDKRRTHEKIVPVDLPSPLKKQRRQVPPPFSDVGDGFEYVFDDLAPAEPVVPPNRAMKTRAKRYLSSVGLPFSFSLPDVLMACPGCSHGSMGSAAR